MNFSSPDKVASVIQNLKTAELRRAPNRGLIDALFNGAPPYTRAEAEENHIQWNVNWNEGADLLLQAREQMENAHLSTDYAFNVRLPDAPKSKQVTYGNEITRLVNKRVRRSRPYFHTQRSKWGSVVLHGTGTQMWADQWTWRPHFVGIDDLLIPTDTELPLENLTHFAVRRRMTPGELFRRTFGKPEEKRDPAWQLEAVRKTLDSFKDVNQNMNHFNWFEHPEKMTEIWKQNSLYFESDAVPVIWAWDFYYQEDEQTGKEYYRKILLDSDCVPSRQAESQDPIVYLYDAKKPFAKKLDHILHIQFLDGNNVPPFMYHSCRGLGLRLHDAVQALNRVRSQLIQKVMEDMMLMFRAQDPVDRSRLDKIYLGMNYAIVPDGLTFVTREQRYTPDAKLVEMQLANLKQLVGEGSSQYTQDIDVGTSKERTAFEVNTLLNQTTRLTGSMLNLSYFQEQFAYQEICRRLTVKNSPDWETKEFQNECKEAGIPEKWLDSERWEIEVTRVLGAGNQQLEQAQAMALMNIRPMLNPEAQNEVTHDYVYAMTHDPKRANRLAPLDAQPRVTDTVHDTELAYGAIMSGAQVTPKSGLAPIEVAATMLKCMSTTVDQITMTDGVGTPQQVLGLQNAAQYAAAFIQQIAQDKTQKAVAKSLNDGLGQIMNEVKAFAQRQQEAQAKNGADPELAAKLKMEMALGQQKLQLNAAEHKQKLQSKQAMDRQKLMTSALQAKARLDADVAASRQRIDAAEQELQAQMRQDNTASAHEVQMEDMKAVHEVHNQSMQAAADLEHSNAQAEADLEHTKAQAKAAAKAKPKTE